MLSSAFGISHGDVREEQMRLRLAALHERPELSEFSSVWIPSLRLGGLILRATEPVGIPLKVRSPSTRRAAVLTARCSAGRRELQRNGSLIIYLLFGLDGDLPVGAAGAAPDSVNKKQ